jgi:DNA-binding transcriptional regulator YiaG
MEPYRYTECGLDNVYIEGMNPCIDDDEDEVYCIPNMTGLHAAIAKAIISHAGGISGKELRFLRTEIGMTQAEMAKIVHRDTQTIGRWERGETPIEPASEALVRILAQERLGLNEDNVSVADVSERCVPTAKPQEIRIDGHDPAHYRSLEAA